MFQVRQHLEHKAGQHIAPAGPALRRTSVLQRESTTSCSLDGWIERGEKETVIQFVICPSDLHC